MSKPIIFSILTDPHLNESNFKEVESALYRAIDKTVKKGCHTLFIGGDIFTDRKTQSFDTLQSFGRVLEYAYKEDVQIIAIPGNHDKIDYESERSYLDIYRHYPGFTLRTGLDMFELESWNIFVLPFFKETTKLHEYIKQLNNRNVPDNSVLITHLAIDGVRNNDGSVISGILPTGTFKRFDHVLVGHYHDKQEIKNITYIGSLLQNNFGEDDLKGITFFHSDGSLTQESVAETRFLTVEINLNEQGKKEIDALVKVYEGAEDRIRFKFQGTKDQFKAVQRSVIEGKGIKVAFKEDLIEEVTVNQEVADNFAAFTKTMILDEWNEYCEKDEERKEVLIPGKELLTEML